MEILPTVNIAMNRFFKTIQSLSTIPIVKWLLRSLALHQVILPSGWPENYNVKGETSNTQIRVYFEICVVASKRPETPHRSSQD